MRYVAALALSAVLAFLAWGAGELHYANCLERAELAVPESRGTFDWSFAEGDEFAAAVREAENRAASGCSRWPWSDIAGVPSHTPAPDEREKGIGGGSIGGGTIGGEELDPTPDKLDGSESYEFEADDIERAEAASPEVREYCEGAVSEAQELGCLSHVEEVP